MEEIGIAVTATTFSVSKCEETLIGDAAQSFERTKNDQPKNV